MSVSDFMNMVQKTRSLGLLESNKVDTFFGLGKPEEEACCPEIRVFMFCVGRTGVEKRRVSLPPHTRLREVRNHFQREMAQTLILDENDFEILDTDHSISHFSKGCNLNVQFSFADSIVTAAGEAVKRGVGLGAAVEDRARL